MIELLIHALVSLLGWVMTLLIFYIVLFRLYYKHKDDQPWWMYPLAICFLVLDVAIQMSAMTILMLDTPKHWTVTERMKSYQRLPNPGNWLDKYHTYVAVNLCMILNVFDKKGHC